MNKLFTGVRCKNWICVQHSFVSVLQGHSEGLWPQVLWYHLLGTLCCDIFVRTSQGL